MVTVTTEKELQAAIKSKEPSIEIEGDLANKTFKIHATGNVAWLVVAGALVITAGAAFVTLGTGGAATPATTPVAGLTAAGATAVLGIGATSSAISIIVASGGVTAGMATLKALRGKYKIVDKSEGRLILKRR
ncbi:hypothetical protein [Leclercia adecarboxylata]|jgi:hypothetical protein|uniref:hypothetical protein n=1 Tax=Leclercia adecarboxylata TaxID=83655 RepID=UPI0013FD1454|nr:hypothetical protein [Leclercia adecarboxylata]QIM45035.1 hypothetical protein G7098_20910 [Leclercia adecarboxylata]